MDNARHERTRSKRNKMSLGNETLPFRREDPDTPVCHEVDEEFEGRVIMAGGIVRQGLKEGCDGFA